MKGSLKLFGVEVITVDVKFVDPQTNPVQALDDLASGGVKWFSAKWFKRMVK